MKKNHQTPEFQVIKQDLANSKFFTASGPDPAFRVTIKGLDYKNKDWS